MHYDLPDKFRFLVVYQDVTKSIKSIQKYTKIPKRTLQRWKSQIEEGIDILEVKEGRGRKKQLAQDEIEKTRMEIEENPHKSSRKLAAQHGTSHTTILSYLHEEGYNYESIDKKPALTEEQKSKR